MGEEGLFDPKLPPIFDVYDDEIVMYQMVPLHCLNESEAYENRGINSEPVNFFGLMKGLGATDRSSLSTNRWDACFGELFGPRHYAIRLAIEVDDALLPHGCTSSPKSVSIIQRVGQNMGRGSRFFTNGTSAAYLSVRMCIWNQQQSSMVFNPGIRQQGKDAIQIIIPTLSTTLECTRIGTILFEEKEYDAKLNR